MNTKVHVLHIGPRGGIAPAALPGPRVGGAPVLAVLSALPPPRQRRRAQTEWMIIPMDGAHASAALPLLTPSSSICC